MKHKPHRKDLILPPSFKLVKVLVAQMFYEEREHAAWRCDKTWAIRETEDAMHEVFQRTPAGNSRGSCQTLGSNYLGAIRMRWGIR